jgi:hypothetical protein
MRSRTLLSHSVIPVATFIFVAPFPPTLVWWSITINGIATGCFHCMTKRSIVEAAAKAAAGEDKREAETRAPQHNAVAEATKLMSTVLFFVNCLRLNWNRKL